MCHWGPFTISIDPYFSELVWKFYASYKALECLLKPKGCTDTFPCLPCVWVHGQEVPITLKAINSLYWAEPIKPNSAFCRKVDDKANQFQWVSDIIVIGQQQWAISRGLIHRRDLKFKACFMPFFQPLDKTVRANGMITLAAKTYRESPTMKRAKAKDIPSMIQQAIKKTMQPVRDKLRSLCTIVEDLENEVITLRKDVATLTGPPRATNPTTPEPAVVTSQPDAPKSPLDDWWCCMTMHQKWCWMRRYILSNHHILQCSL
ncbi:hypothetical protein HAX54_008220 [Datura stramonium]|uniref:Uncharacterized protein n=1 Tax=Datura stramonium TaxID=4076 RepID=A0ABS8TCV4_DATST|nr:hypothetical protein [Datura stramonium]